ncbi:unnamed protein product [Ectocarpus sp. 6 AP-2014]
MSGLTQRTSANAKAMSPGDGASNGGELAAAPRKGLPMEVKLVICVLGIYSCYMLSGLLQENIFRYRSEDGGRFSSTLFLLWVQCVVNVAFSLVAMFVNGRSGDKMPHHLFGTAGFAYIGAMVCSIEALKYVNFPTKELGKSCKMIPVMLFGVLFAKKQYSLQEYLCVALITVGIVTFNLSGKPHNKEDKENSTYGLGLLAFSLILDGVTGSAQERLKAACKPTVHEMMFFMNAWALAILSAAAYLSGQAVEGYAFCSANPSVMSYVLGFSLAAAFGQNFIYYTISNFNPLVCTTITTTRKFFTIVCSVIIFGHAIGPKQWGGVAMVFAGIGYEMRGKYQRHHAKNLKA